MMKKKTMVVKPVSAGTMKQIKKVKRVKIKVKKK